MSSVAGSASAAAPIYYHLLAKSRAKRRVDPLMPMLSHTRPRLSKKGAEGLRRLETAVRDEYGRDLTELSDAEQQSVLKAVRDELLGLVRHASAYDEKLVSRSLDSLREQKPLK